MSYIYILLITINVFKTFLQQCLKALVERSAFLKVKLSIRFDGAEVGPTYATGVKQTTRGLGVQMQLYS